MTTELTPRQQQVVDALMGDRAEMEAHFERTITRPRRSIAQLVRNLGLPGTVMAGAVIVYLALVAATNLVSPFAWAMLAVCILGATIPRLFINAMVTHQRRMHGIWRWSRRIVLAVLALTLVGVVPRSVLVSGVLLVATSFYLGTLLWTYADSRIVTLRHVQSTLKKEAARLAMRDRLAAHAQAHPPRDPDDSVYRRVR